MIEAVYFGIVMPVSAGAFVFGMLVMVASAIVGRID